MKNTYASGMVVLEYPENRFTGFLRAISGMFDGLPDLYADVSHET